MGNRRQTECNQARLNCWGAKEEGEANKRIAATLFLWFLNNNHILYREDGSKRLADNTLVALTLMIAESKTEEKDVMVKVVVNLINQQNV